MRGVSVKAGLLLAFCAFCWGTNVTLGRAVHVEIPPVGLSFWRWAVACLVLSAFTWKSVAREWPVIRRAWKQLCFLALAGMAAFHTSLYLAVNYTTAINAALILSASPVMVPILSWLLHGEGLSRRFAVGLILSLIGVGVVITRMDPAVISGLGLNLGDFFMLGAAFFWSLYTVLLRRKPAALSAPVFLTALTAIASAMILPLYVLESLALRTMPISWTALGVVAYVALVASVLAFFAFNRGIEVLGPNRGGLFLHLVPVFAAILGIVFLGERLQWFHAVGIVCVAAGIFLATNDPSRWEGRP